MSDEEKKAEGEVVIVHIAGRRNDPKTCPQSNEGKCTNPECAGAVVEHGYGYAGGYGLGGYSYCEKCSTIYDFFEDRS